MGLGMRIRPVCYTKSDRFSKTNEAMNMNCFTLQGPSSASFSEPLPGAPDQTCRGVDVSLSFSLPHRIIFISRCKKVKWKPNKWLNCQCQNASKTEYLTPCILMCHLYGFIAVCLIFICIVGVFNIITLLSQKRTRYTQIMLFSQKFQKTLWILVSARFSTVYIYVA